MRHGSPRPTGARAGRGASRAPRRGLSHGLRCGRRRRPVVPAPAGHV